VQRSRGAALTAQAQDRQAGAARSVVLSLLLRVDWGVPFERTIGAERIGADGAPETDHDLRTLITVSRTHGSDAGHRQVVVRIDDGAPIQLRHGQSFTQEVGPGSHRLRANNTCVWKKVDFSVESGEHLEFVVINKFGPIWFAVAAILGAAPMFLSIHRRSVV
jgi:hypothetical protein